MLLTYEQMKYLEPNVDGTFKFVDDGKASESEKRELLDIDTEYHEIYQQHIISNFEDLKNNCLR